MASILVHITTGPENPTRAALGFLVARAAVEETELAGKPVELAMPNRLVQLALRATACSRTEPRCPTPRWQA